MGWEMGTRGRNDSSGVEVYEFMGLFTLMQKKAAWQLTNLNVGLVTAMRNCFGA